MKRFIIERKLPGAGTMSHDELQAISRISMNAVATFNKPYRWIESLVTEDVIFCVHETDDEELIYRHAEICGFPINRVEEVRTIIGPGSKGWSFWF